MLAVAALAVTATMGTASRAAAQGSIEIGDQQLLTSTSEPFFVGGDYQWGLDQIWVPSDPTAAPLSVTFAWGDGSSDTVVSDQSYPDLPVWQGCDGNRCFAWVGHTYSAQGLYTIAVTAEQADAATATYTGYAAIYDLAAGGSVKGSGTLTARSGGMYDQGFTEGTMSFQVSVKRRAGAAATSGSLLVDVPSMTPDYPDGTDRGMTFTGTAPTRPLYVQSGSARGSYEIYLERVYGSVTKLTAAGTRVSAGTAYATLHATLAKGQVSRIRITIWNTSAGYTYVDTAPDGQPPYSLTADEVLLSGSVKVG